MVVYEVEMGRIIQEGYINPWQYRAVRENGEPSLWSSLPSLASILAEEYNKKNDFFNFYHRKVENRSVQTSGYQFFEHAEISKDDLTRLTQLFLQEISSSKTHQNDSLTMRLPQ